MPGTYRGVAATPNSEADKAGRQGAGMAAHVLQLRFCGVFLPARLLAQRPVVAGLVVSTEHDVTEWRVDVHPATGEDRQLLHTLAQARVVKERDDGCILLAGLEWDEGYLQRWPQTWLCAPDRPALGAAVASMSAWLDTQYTGEF